MKAFLLILLFQCGFVCALHASALRFGQPEGFGSWARLCVSVAFGLLTGIVVWKWEAKE
jgi:hypothetical protein